MAFTLPSGLRPAPEGTAEPTLVPAERRFRLPPLAIHPLVPAPPPLLAEPLDHLPPVRRLRPLPAAAAAVQRDHRGPDPEVLPAVPVVLLAVERGIGQHPVPG